MVVLKIMQLPTLCVNLEIICRAVVVAQLVERSLLTPEVRGLNPNIGKFYLPIVHLNRKDKNKEKRGQEWPSLKN